MPKISGVCGFAAIMVVVSAACWAQDKPAATAKPAAEQTAAPKTAEKLTLAYKGQKGLVARYKTKAELKMEAEGVKLALEVSQTEKDTVSNVATNGNITFDAQVEVLERSANGQKAPEDDLSKMSSSHVIAPDGALVSYTAHDPDDSKPDARQYVAMSIVFPATPVGVGDKWSHDYKPNESLGQREAHADFEILASEMKNNVDTFKIKMAFQEKSGKHPMRVNGTFWVEKTSGDTVYSDGTVENLIFGGDEDGQTASGTIHSERLSGSPIDAASSKASKPEEKKEKTIDETVKDFEKLPGYFTLYRKKENGRDTLYAEIKEEQLEKLMMLETTASTGNASRIVAGDPISDLVFKFVKNNDKILLVRPNINFLANEKTPIARAVKRSFADAILESYTIEAKQADRKSLLINLSGLFIGDLAQISQKLSGGGGLAALFGGGGGGFGMDREKTYIASLKNFPENLNIETQYHFVGSGRGQSGDPGLADDRSLPLRVNYCLFPLPIDGYRPRLADPRVGFFQTEFQSFDDDAKDDVMVRYIYRWRMEKADPKAALSAPKKPIVFWLDNAIPAEYRDAVKEGLLAWNPAFEKVGIKDAIVVKQMPDNADWDHADMRYNTIRWVASPDAGYAVAQFRVNPITGEILNANITVDANFTRYIKQERRKNVNPAAFFDLPDPAKFLASTKSASAASTNAPAAGKVDLFKCEMAQGMMEQGWFGSTAMRLMDPDNKIDDKAYLHAYLRHVVAHEMGHIMGLRHNFIASTEQGAADLQNEKSIQKMGIAASVMDYTPFNVFALKHKGVDFYQAGIGPYDTWAMEYGYANIDGKTPQDELLRLRNIASKCNEPGHGYESDEAADGFDPAVVRFDLGKNPLDYYQKTLEVSRHLLLHLGERVPKNGESYWQFTQDFDGLLGQYVRAASLAARYVGGLHVNRNFKGDPNEKPALAPLAVGDQKRALQMIDTYILAPDAFTFPRDYYTKMAGDPNGFDITALMGGNGPSEAPLRDTFAGIQKSALNRLFAPSTLKRIANNEFKTGDPKLALTLPYLFRSVGSTVWAELETRQPIGPLHRQLQRTYLDTLIGMATNTSNSAPDDAKMLAWDQLRQLKSRIAALQSAKMSVGQTAKSGKAATAGKAGLQASSAPDEYTRIHLAETLARITRALDANMTIGNGSSGGGSGLSFLMGTEPNGK